MRLHKLGESNSCIAKMFHIRRETVWRVVKKFQETGKHAIDQGRAGNVQSERKNLLKTRGNMGLNSP